MAIWDSSDSGTAAIAARFNIGAAVGAGAGAGTDEAMAATLGTRARLRPVRPFNLPPGLIASGSAAGTYLDLPAQFGPPNGYFWDITALSAYGFTAGTIAVSKNAPIVTSAGNPNAIEAVGSFAQAGVIPYPQHGMPLLDSSERLVFTVTSALTGFAQISGQVIAIPAERIDEYLS